MRTEGAGQRNERCPVFWSLCWEDVECLSQRSRAVLMESSCQLMWVYREMGRQHRRVDRPGVRHVPEDSGEQRKMEETGCEVMCGGSTTLAVKG